jgi:hypothetical protein
MKVKVQGKEIEVGFDAYMALKNENSDLEVVSYSDHSVEDQYTDELMKCKIFIAHINKLMNLLPSPDRAIYTDYSSAYAMREHLDMVYDMLTSWTGFECNND